MGNTNGKTGKAAQIIIIIMFLAGMFLPLLKMVIAPDEYSAKNILRFVAARGLGWSSPEVLGRYAKVNFGFRTFLLRARGVVFFQWLGMPTSVNRNVVVGKKGWLFLNMENELDDYMGVRSYTDEELENQRILLERRRDELAALGAEYLFVICPNKVTIYPEYLPAWVKKTKRGTPMDKFVNYFAAHSDLRVIDLRPALLEAKKRHRVYYLTDTHWNRYGGYAAYRELAGDIAEIFPEIKARPIGNYRIRKSRAPGGDLAGIFGLTGRDLEEDDWLFEPRVPRVSERKLTPTGKEGVVATRCAGGEIPRAVIHHDSFMTYVRPFLAEHFREAVFVDKGKFDMDMIKKRRPNLVIEETVERLLKK